LAARTSERIRQIDPAARDPASPHDAGRMPLPSAFQTKWAPVTDGGFIFPIETDCRAMGGPPPPPHLAP
jgi:hypothetical protein